MTGVAFTLVEHSQDGPGSQLQKEIKEAQLQKEIKEAQLQKEIKEAQLQKERNPRSSPDVMLLLALCSGCSRRIFMLLIVPPSTTGHQAELRGVHLISGTHWRHDETEA